MLCKRKNDALQILFICVAVPNLLPNQQSSFLTSNTGKILSSPTIMRSIVTLANCQSYYWFENIHPQKPIHNNKNNNKHVRSVHYCPQREK